jgi:hypothetical protein
MESCHRYSPASGEGMPRAKMPGKALDPKGLSTSANALALQVSTSKPATARATHARPEGMRLTNGFDGSRPA